MALVSVTNNFFRKGHEDSFDDCSSYGSLSIACQFGGPSERMLCKNPNQILGTNIVLADNQEGFRRKRSTFRLLYWLYLNLEHSRFTKPSNALLNIDHENVYENVGIDVLIYKVRAY